MSICPGCGRNYDAANFNQQNNYGGYSPTPDPRRHNSFNQHHYGQPLTTSGIQSPGYDRHSYRNNFQDPNNFQQNLQPNHAHISNFNTNSYAQPVNPAPIPANWSTNSDQNPPYRYY